MRDDVSASRGGRPAGVARARAIAGLATLVAIAGATVATTNGCSNSTEPAAGPRSCKKDSDCGHGQYCTEASQCRADCFTDRDCMGPYPDAQCNAQGRCIFPVDASTPPDVGPIDSASGDTTADAPEGDGAGP